MKLSRLPLAGRCMDCFSKVRCFSPAQYQSLYLTKQPQITFSLDDEMCWANSTFQLGYLDQ